MKKKFNINKSSSAKSVSMAIQRAGEGLKEASVIVVKNGDKILFGKRKDSLLYTLPGGGMELNESPFQTAVRELFEETNIRVSNEDRALIHKGTKLNDDGWLVHVFEYDFTTNRQGSGNISTENDPDDEVYFWEWVQVDSFRWKEVMSLQQHPKNVALELVGLL